MKQISKIIIIALTIRLLIAPFTAHPFDMYCWYSFFANPTISYARPLWDLTLYLLSIVYQFLRQIDLAPLPASLLPTYMHPQWGVQIITPPLFNILVKLPSILADIGTALLLYRMLPEKKEFYSALFLFNPLTLWISSGWGQYDSLPAFFTVLAVFLLMKSKAASSIPLLISALLKVYPIAFVLPSAVLLSKEGRRKLLLFFVPFFPFLMLTLLNPGILLLFSPLQGKFFDIVGFGLTYWSISFVMPVDFEAANVASLAILVILGTASTILILRCSSKEKLLFLALSGLLLSAPFFLSSRYVAEQRFVWLVPFLVILVYYRVIPMSAYCGISLVAFLYTQKNFPFYLLPIATINKEFISPLFLHTQSFRAVSDGIMLPTQLSGIVLFILGSLFSALLFYMYIKGAAHCLSNGRK